MKKICSILICIFCICTSFVLASEGLENNIQNLLSSHDENYDNSSDILTSNNTISTTNSFDGENIMEANDEIYTTGKAEDLILLAGGTINSFATGKYAFVAGEKISISNVIEKDAFIAGNKIIINGYIGRDIYFAASEIVINGEIGRNAYLFAGKVIIGKESIINGDLYIAASKIEIEDGATINGTVTYGSNSSVIIPNSIKTNIIQENENVKISTKNSMLSVIKDFLFWLFCNIILFIITMLLAPGLFERISNAIKNKGGIIYASSLGFGLLLLILIPILSLIAIITIIGMLLGFTASFMYITILAFSTVLTGYLIGSTIFKNSKINKYLVGIIGILIVQVLRIIPLIGGFISFIAILLAFGIVVQIMKKENKVVNGNNTIEN